MKEFLNELKKKYYKEHNIDGCDMVYKIEKYLEELENKIAQHERARDNFKRFLSKQLDESVKKFDKKDPIMRERINAYCDILKDYNVFMK